MMQIPVNTPLLDGNEEKYLSECIRSGWISSEGPFVERFEEEFSQYIGVKAAAAVSSGTAALDLVFEALDLEAGDEVIVPTFTIISCIQHLLRKGVSIKFVDCDEATLNVTPSDVISAITQKTKAILLVHIYGLSIDVDPIMSVARSKNITVIEDAAEVHGLTYKGKKCGSLCDISIFSFYPNKHITTGEGGMVLSDNHNLISKVKGLRNLCFGPERFVHHSIGWNYRMSNLQAAVGVAQLERIDDIILKKRGIGKQYRERLEDQSQLLLQPRETEYCENIYWVNSVQLMKHDKIQVMKFLKEKGIGTRPFFYPLHLQPIVTSSGTHIHTSLGKSVTAYSRGFYLPSGLALTSVEIDYVCDNLLSFLNDT